MIKKLHLTHGLAILAMAVFMLFPGIGWGQIAGLELGTAAQSSNTTGVATFTIKDANINALPSLTLTVSQQGQAGGNGYIGSKAWNNTNLTNTTYWQFTVTAASGYQIAVTSMALRMYRSSTGPASIALGTDADNYASQIGGIQTLASAVNSTVSFLNLSLSGKSSITFRVYAYGATSAGGTLRIGDGASSSLDINLQGAVTSTAIPTINLNNTSFPQISTDATPNPSAAKVVLSKFKADVTNLDATINSLAFKTAGTYAASDISKLELYYSTSSSMPGTSLAYTTTIPATGSTVTFGSLSQTITLGTSGYFWITCDLAPTATTTKTVGVLGTGSSGLVLTFASGTPTGTIADPTLQTITASSLTPQTISFGALSNVTYGDAPFTVSATGGGSGNPVIFTSSNTSNATCTGTNGTTITIIAQGSCNIYANQAGNVSYNAATQVGQALIVNKKALTLPDAAATSKVYDGTNAAVITGTLTGKVGSDVVTLNGTGTFADVNVANGIAVTSTSTLGGAGASNYSLNQPTGLTANITQAAQTITFGALAGKAFGSAPFDLTATASSGLTVSYTSSDLNVATILGATVTIVGIGTTTITSKQSGNTNYSAASDVTQSLTVIGVIAKWSFDGIVVSGTAANTPSLTSGSAIADLGGQTAGSAFSAFHASNSTVWSTVTGNGSAKSLSSNFWAIGDYFQFVASLAGYQNTLLSFDQTGSNTGPKDFKLQYSTNGTSFNDFGSAIALTNDNWSAGTYKAASTRSFDLSSITSINGLSSAYFRVVATSINAISGTFGTGGTSRIDNFTITGSIIPPTVSTQAVGAIGTQTAEGNGTIESIGGAALTTRGFCWDLSTNADPTTALSTKAVETGTFSTGAFTGSITGLSQNTTYKIRAYAINGGGTSYGSVLSFTTLAATSTYTGTGNWSVSGNWSNGIPTSANDAIVNGDVTIDVAAETMNLTINTAKSVTISDTRSLTVNGILTNSAGISSLVVKSGASLIESTPNISATVERNITADKYHSFSPSVNGAGVTASIFNITVSPRLDVYLYSHNEANNADAKGGYSEITDITTALLPMAGYGLYADGAHATPVQTDWTFTEQGDLNTGAYGTAGNMTKTGAGSFAGFNYVGNPYPSYIDWNAASGWVKTNIAGATYVENAGNWATYTSPGPGTYSGSNIIAPGQGFFVQVTSGTTGTLTMNNNVRTHSSTPYLKSSPTNFVRLVASGNNKTDETVIRFDSDATAQFDGQYDAIKLDASDMNFPQIYSVSDRKLAYNALPETGTVQLGFKAGVSGSYNIGINDVADLHFVTLEDTKTGIFTDLSAGSYTFNFVAGENELRFKLHFSALSIAEIKSTDAGIYSYQKTVFVNLKEHVKGDIYIYNISGQLVASKASAEGMNEIGLTVTGNYVVKVITRDCSLARKVFVN